MHTISVEIYSENATNGIFYKSGLTQSWNTVHREQKQIVLVLSKNKRISGIKNLYYGHYQEINWTQTFQTDETDETDETVFIN